MNYAHRWRLAVALRQPYPNVSDTGFFTADPNVQGGVIWQEETPSWALGLPPMVTFQPTNYGPGYDYSVEEAQQRAEVRRRAIKTSFLFAGAAAGVGLLLSLGAKS